MHPRAQGEHDGAHRERRVAHIERFAAPWQLEDRGRKAAESPPPVPGAYILLRAIARPLVVVRGLDRPMRPPATLVVIKQVRNSA